MEQKFKTGSEFSKGYMYVCYGPSSISCNGPNKVPFSEIGKTTCISKCLGYPDCTCGNYLKAVDIMEALEKGTNEDS